MAGPPDIVEPQGFISLPAACCARLSRSGARNGRNRLPMQPRPRSRAMSWTPNEEYYALAHASRFVRPGAHRIHVEGEFDGMGAVAFRDAEGRKVLILVYVEQTPRELSIRAGDAAFRYSLGPRSVATLSWR